MTIDIDDLRNTLRTYRDYITADSLCAWVDGAYDSLSSDAVDHVVTVDNLDAYIAADIANLRVIAANSSNEEIHTAIARGYYNATSERALLSHPVLNVDTLKTLLSHRAARPIPGSLLGVYATHARQHRIVIEATTAEALDAAFTNNPSSALVRFVSTHLWVDVLAARTADGVENTGWDSNIWGVFADAADPDDILETAGPELTDRILLAVNMNQRYTWQPLPHTWVPHEVNEHTRELINTMYTALAERSHSVFTERVIKHVQDQFNDDGLIEN